MPMSENLSLQTINMRNHVYNNILNIKCEVLVTDISQSGDVWFLDVRKGRMFYPTEESRDNELEVIIDLITK